MAKLAMTAVGGIVGQAVGQPGIGMMLGGMIGGYLERRGVDPIRQEGPRLDDMHVQVSGYGLPIFRMWGTMRMAGTIIWTSDKVETISDETTGGGKSGPETVTTSYIYHASFAIAICTGPIERLLRIWADGKLIYNIIPTNSSVTRLTGVNFTFHKGTETQIADPIIQAIEGAGNVPGHRGICYIVFDMFPLALFGNRIPNFSFDVTTLEAEEDSTNGEPPYTEFDGAMTGASAPGDSIVFFPDNINFMIEQHADWDKCEVLNGTVVKTETISEIQSTVTYFDIDEQNNIYVVITTQSGGYYMLKIDGISISTIARGGNEFPSGLTQLRAFRNPEYPFIVTMRPSSDAWDEPGSEYKANIFITKKGRLYSRYWTGGEIVTGNLFSWGPDIIPHAIDLDDDNGRIYIYANHNYYSAEQYTARLALWQLDRSGNVEQLKNPRLVINDGSPYHGLCEEILFDAASNQIILANPTDDELLFIDAETFVVLSIVNVTMDTSKLHSAFRHGVQNGFLYIAAVTISNMIYKINVTTYTIEETYELADSDVIWSGGSCYDPLSNSIIGTVLVNDEPRAIKMPLDRGTYSTQYVPLATIVDDICDLSGIDSATEVDTTALTAQLNGFTLNEAMRSRAALQVLMEGFFFGAVESDGVLKFIPWGEASIVSIPETDLAASAGERPQQLITSRREEIGMPAELNLLYVDPHTDYQINIQRAMKRQLTQSKEILSIRLPVALDQNVAKQICAKMFQQIWTERIGHTIVISRKYMYLDPGDVITIIEGGIQHTMRIELIQYGRGVITLETVNTDAAAYISEEEGNTIPPPDPPPIKHTGPTMLVIVDVPAMYRGVDPMVFLAVTGYTDDWVGSAIQRSVSA